MSSEGCDEEGGRRQHVSLGIKIETRASKQPGGSEATLCCNNIPPLRGGVCVCVYCGHPLPTLPGNQQKGRKDILPWPEGPVADQAASAKHPVRNYMPLYNSSRGAGSNAKTLSASLSKEYLFNPESRIHMCSRAFNKHGDGAASTSLPSGWSLSSLVHDASIHLKIVEGPSRLRKRFWKGKVDKNCTGVETIRTQ